MNNNVDWIEGSEDCRESKWVSAMAYVVIGMAIATVVLHYTVIAPCLASMN